MVDGRETLGELAARIRSVTDDEIQGWIGEALGEAMPEVVAANRRNFGESKTPDGEKWPDLKWKRPGESRDFPPLIDTGNLLRTIAGEVRGSQLVLWTGHKAAFLHQYGDTIVPVNAHYLCIPKTVAAKRAKSPRNYPDRLFPRVNKERTRGVLLAEGDDPDSPMGADGLHVAYFLTVGPVVIPAREFLGYSTEMVGYVLDLVADRVIDRWLLGRN